MHAHPREEVLGGLSKRLPWRQALRMVSGSPSCGTDLCGHLRAAVPRKFQQALNRALEFLVAVRFLRICPCRITDLRILGTGLRFRASRRQPRSVRPRRAHRDTGCRGPGRRGCVRMTACCAPRPARCSSCGKSRSRRPALNASLLSHGIKLEPLLVVEAIQVEVVDAVVAEEAVVVGEEHFDRDVPDELCRDR